MNNKRLGTLFERQMVDFLNINGWWVHFISPDNTGAQPFDIIAVGYGGEVLGIDCKTSSKPTFPLSRVEDNQRYAFKKFEKAGGKAFLAVKYEDVVYKVPYSLIENCSAKSIRLDECKIIARERGGVLWSLL